MSTLDILFNKIVFNVLYIEKSKINIKTIPAYNIDYYSMKGHHQSPRTISSYSESKTQMEDVLYIQRTKPSFWASLSLSLSLLSPVYVGVRPIMSGSETRSPLPLLFRRRSSGDITKNLASVSSSLLPAFGTVVDDGYLNLKKYVIAPYDRRYRWVYLLDFFSVLVLCFSDHLLYFSTISCSWI